MELEYSTMSSEGSVLSSDMSQESLRMEECRVEGVELRLPQGLCESKELFREFFSINTWQEFFNDQQREHLKSFLPQFPENDEEEKEETLRRLFACENFRFGSPLTDFFGQLTSGYFRPDIARMRSLMKKAHIRDYRYRQRRHALRLMRAVLVSRQRLLDSVRQLPPGAAPPRPPLPPPPLPSHAALNSSAAPYHLAGVGGPGAAAAAPGSPAGEAAEAGGGAGGKGRRAQMELRVRRRYFEELAAIRSEVQESEHSSDDDNFPEGPPPPLTKRQKRALALLESQAAAAVGGGVIGGAVGGAGAGTPPPCVVSTLAARPQGLDLEAKVSGLHNPFEPTEDAYRAMLLRHKRRRLEGDMHPELSTNGLTLSEVALRANLPRRAPPPAAANHLRPPASPASRAASPSTPSPGGASARRRGRPDAIAARASAASRAAAAQVAHQPYASRIARQAALAAAADSSEASDGDWDPEAAAAAAAAAAVSATPSRGRNRRRVASSSVGDADDLADGADSPPPRAPLHHPTARSVAASRAAAAAAAVAALSDDEDDDEEEEEEEDSSAAGMTSAEGGDSGAESGSETAPPTPSPVQPAAHHPQFGTPRGRRPSTISTGSSPRSVRGGDGTPMRPPGMGPGASAAAARAKAAAAAAAAAAASTPEAEAASAVASITVGVASGAGADRALSPAAAPASAATPAQAASASSGYANDHLIDIKPAPELMQETHACFFSLIRDVLCSTSQHRMALATLADRLRAWQESPISPLNDWYSLAPSWPALLPSAVAFLCGDYPEVQPEDFVPFLENKRTLGVFQWIGAGRDSDARLAPLCRLWLDRRDELRTPKQTNQKQLQDGAAEDASAGAAGATGEERLSLAASPPPPRCPTSWVVRPSTAEERRDFREQERRRYANPHRAFTYRMHGYESVVGPVKGAYGGGAAANKPRGHSLLVADRPNFVTILALVRDATARLPNGEGTRSDICELLRDSQYLAPSGASSGAAAAASGASSGAGAAGGGGGGGGGSGGGAGASAAAHESLLHSVVSGALDRLHYEPDPCVRYDTKRKTWLYLHRARTEQEFERLHQQQQGAAKTKKAAGPRKISRAKKDPAAAAAVAALVASPPAAAPVTVKTEPVVKVEAAVKAEAVVCKTEPMSSPPPATPPTAAAPSPATSAPAAVAATVTVATAASPAAVAAAAAASRATPTTLLAGKSLLASSVQVRGRSMKAGGGSPVTGVMKTVTLTPQQVQAVATARSVVAAQAKAAGQVRAQLVDASGQGSSPQHVAAAVQQLQQQQQAQQQQQQQVSTAVAAAAQRARGVVPGAATAAAAAKALGLAGVRLVNAAAGSGPGTTTLAGGGPQTIFIRQQALPQNKVAAAQVQVSQSNASGTTAETATQQQAQLLLQQQAKQAAAIAQLQQQLQQQQQLKQLQMQQQQLKQQQQQVTATAVATGQPRLVTSMSVLGPGQPRVITRVGGKPIPVSHVTLAAAGGGSQVVASGTTVARTMVTQATLTQQQAAAIAAQGRVQGQMISVESLLAQQKQQQQKQQQERTFFQVNNVRAQQQGQVQGSTTQTTTVPAGASLIQLAAPGGGPAQFAVVSQGSLLSVGGQPARLLQQANAQAAVAAAGGKIGAGATTAGLRVLGPGATAAGLNLAHIGGKPVLLASKPATAGQAQGTTNMQTLRPGVVLATQPVSGGATVTGATSATVTAGTGVSTGAPGTAQTVVLASQALRASAGGALLLQGGGGPAQQILLPPGFAGGTLNIKTLQGLKVIPLAQAGAAGTAGAGGAAAGKGRQQVYARIIGPGLRACSPGIQAQTVTAQATANVTQNSSDPAATAGQTE